MEKVVVNQGNATTVRKGQNQKTDDMISLRELLDIFLSNWKWFLLSVIVCVALARLYLATKPNIYKRQAVMLVKDDNSTSRRGAISTDALMQFSVALPNSIQIGVDIHSCPSVRTHVKHGV